MKTRYNQKLRPSHHNKQLSNNHIMQYKLTSNTNKNILNNQQKIQMLSKKLIKKILKQIKSF